MAELGQGDEGVAQIREAIAALSSTRNDLLSPFFLVTLAEAYGSAGRIEEGSNSATEALRVAKETGESCWEALIYRVRGELLLKQHASNSLEAEADFERAIATARKQGAKSLELRATTNYARVLRDTDRRNEARTILGEIYGWFTEGFDTADLKGAKAILDELGS